MIHTATLVHDDVIDIAKTRRGRPASNIVWGNHVSVLAGDWLYMQAFELAMRERNFHILDVLISLTQLMVEGELLQLDRLRRIDITEADYMELIDRKTAGIVLGMREPGRDCCTELTKPPSPIWATLPGTWEWRFSWSTTSSTSPRPRRFWASRRGTICAKAKSHCR